MNKLTHGSKVAIFAVMAVVAGAVVIFYGMNNGPTGVAPENGSPSGSSSTVTNTGATATNTSSGGTTGGTVKKTPVVAVKPITIITPIAGETWKIMTKNVVTWSREALVSGQIELLDASTKKLVGVILNQTGPHQTSYEWNTRDLLVSRTNPAKITVLPGSYLIRISFDGNNLSPVTSQAITLQQ